MNLTKLMAEVKILIQGYVSGEAEGTSCSTITLVKDKDLNIIVDPGTAKSQELIKEKLKEEGLTVEDIDIVFLTHSHIDHFRNIGMFPNAKSLDYWGYWEGDLQKKSDGKITDDIFFIKTPGHSKDSITLLVKTEKGLIAICGDVFWKKDFPKKDPFAQDLIELEKSRKKLLEIADYIIPGHGLMFETR